MQFGRYRGAAVNTHALRAAAERAGLSPHQVRLYLELARCERALAVSMTGA